MASGSKLAMAHSARILATIQKIEAADAAHFAPLRERAKNDDARAKTLEKKRANLRKARAIQVLRQAGTRTVRSPRVSGKPLLDQANRSRGLTQR